MAPPKRSRPAFSPPRPRKAGSASTKSKSTRAATKSKTQGIGKQTTGKSNSSKSKAKPKSDQQRRSRLVSPTPSASDSLGGDSNEGEDEEDNMTVDDEDEEEPTSPTNHDTEDSPEPDYILAEVTHDSDTSSKPPIPLDLIHRILHSQFAKPEKTKISTDAKEVVGKYIEVFVREAIMRCAYEKTESVGGENTTGSSGGGWLELEDLEKVAVQLCLDF